MLRVLLALILTALVPGFPALGAGGLRGPAAVVDGNTLVVAGQQFRLFGSDAPDIGQSCLYRERAFFCGDIARTALLDLVAGAKLSCRLRGRGENGRQSASCTAGGADVAANMVHTGWAVANADEVPGYARIEAKAKAARRGMWRGQFMRPAVWRQQTGARESFCLRGRPTGEGAECPAIRTASGVLYSLAGGRAGSFTPGAEICVCGGLVGKSLCLQGRVMSVTRILDAPACP